MTLDLLQVSYKGWLPKTQLIVLHILWRENGDIFSSETLRVSARTGAVSCLV